MKYGFLLILVVLTALSVWLEASMPEDSSDREVLLYWTTDSNPARIEQIRLFDAWQVERGLVDEQGTPLIELRLDVGNADKTKKVVQSVSGVAAAVMDLTSGSDMRFFQQMGVLEPVEDIAGELGFGVDATFDSITEEISLIDAEGVRRHYGFPCNIAVTMLMANRDLFAAVGMDTPPLRWTPAEFQKIGREWVRRANAPGNGLPYLPGRRFFIDQLDPIHLYRGAGVDTFNETLTRNQLEAPEVIEALRLNRRWTYDDRLIPSGADTAAMNSSGGFGGAGAVAFDGGRYALFVGGRWSLIRFRQSNADRHARGEPPLSIATCQFPAESHPNVVIRTREAVAYIDGARLDRDVEFTAENGETVVVPGGTPWAVFFQAFLASKEYNAQIIADSDGLPPNPAFTDSQAYLRPEPDPRLGIFPETEYDVHGPHLEAAKSIADPRSYSPFILFEEANRLEIEARSKYLSNPPIPGFESAEAAMADAARRIEEQVARNLVGLPALQAEYESRLADQAEIDRRKAAGEPIPASLVRNPFYLRLYREQGRLLADGGGGPRELDVPPPREASDEVVGSPEATLPPPPVGGNDPVERMLDDAADTAPTPAPSLAATRPAPSAPSPSPATLPATRP